MRVHTETPRYLVIDDFLPPEQFELMREYIPYARCTVAGFFLGERDQTPFRR